MGEVFGLAVERDYLWVALDVLADRLTYGAMLRKKLTEARARLNLLSPGAGDYLEGDTNND